MWFYKNEEVLELPENCVGFVYLITNLTNGRMYVGKKLSRFSKTTYRMVTQKNGVKKRKKIKSSIESDWREYYGSSIELNRDVDELGREKFRREILYYCDTKSMCSYVELREQMDRRVMETDLYYNGNVLARVHKSHVFGKIEKILSK